LAHVHSANLASVLGNDLSLPSGLLPLSFSGGTFALPLAFSGGMFALPLAFSCLFCPSFHCLHSPSFSLIPELHKFSDYLISLYPLIVRWIGVTS
jgi:hypothetical protein